VQMRQGPLGRRTMSWSFVARIQHGQRCGKGRPHRSDRANRAADRAVSMQAGPGVAVLVLVLQPRGLRRGPNVLVSWAYAGRKRCARCCVCRNHDEREPDDQGG